jgi:hypothetical protein
MQSTSVDVVSLNPAEGIDAEVGQAEKDAVSLLATVVAEAAAEAGDAASTGTSAAITATAVKTPIRRFKWESMLPP